MAKALANQQNTPPPERVHGGPKLVEPPVRPLQAAEAEQSTTAKISDWKQVLGEKVDDLRERSAEALGELQESASETYQQTKAKASITLERAKARSTEAAQQARARARGLVENYPLELLAGVAAVAFVAGVLLRIWRSSRYE